MVKEVYLQMIKSKIRDTKIELYGTPVFMAA